MINIPSLSLTIGIIVKWYMAEGKSIAAGDVLWNIQTDMADWLAKSASCRCYNTNSSNKISDNNTNKCRNKSQEEE